MRNINTFFVKQDTVMSAYFLFYITAAIYYPLKQNDFI